MPGLRGRLHRPLHRRRHLNLHCSVSANDAADHLRRDNCLFRDTPGTSPHYLNYKEYQIMNATDLIRFALHLSEQGTVRLIEDIRNAPLTQPCANGGNHPLWNMGHIAFIEGNMRRIVTGEPNPVEHWAPLFAPGTQPKTDANA